MAYTQQSIFDAVARHLLAQGKPAVNGTACQYRTPSGGMCAVGCLIPDAEYHRDMEWETIANVSAGSPTLSDIRNVVGDQFLTQLQRAHDYPRGDDGEPSAVSLDFDQWLDEWKLAMLDLANRHGLDKSAFMRPFVEGNWYRNRNGLHVYVLRDDNTDRDGLPLMVIWPISHPHHEWDWTTATFAGLEHGKNAGWDLMPGVVQPPAGHPPIPPRHAFGGIG